MSNSYFQFKQFRIEQDKCAMKVTTDACIHGAWTPMSKDLLSVLDIGAGTGLLSLMLAQRNAEIKIDAIELNHDAALQCSNNVANSPWGKRIELFEGDFRIHYFNKKYDLIIVNPPFFSHSLLSEDLSRNAARHDESLTFEELTQKIAELLDTNGSLSILLPNGAFSLFQSYAINVGLRLSKRLSVKHHSFAPAKRVVGIFTKSDELEYYEDELIIKHSDQFYTQQFKDLLREYYLEF